VTDDGADDLDGRGAAGRSSALWNRRLFDGARDAIHIVDLDGQLIDCNAAFLEHLGYTWDEARRLRVWDWDPGETAERTPAALRRLSRADRPLDTTHRRKDGTIVDVELTFARVDFAGRGYVMAVARDASFRRQQERRQRELAELLQRVIEEASSGIGLFDAEGRCLLANVSLARIFETRDVLVPGPGLEALFGAAHATIAPAIACALATGEVQRLDVDVLTPAWPRSSSRSSPSRRAGGGTSCSRCRTSASSGRSSAPSARRPRAPRPPPRPRARSSRT
jgi:PAS domain S-box-containing protein